MEGDAVEETDEQERPVGAAFGEFDVGAVVDGEEDVRGVGEVWEGVFEGGGVGGLHEHEGHGGAEEDDVGVGVLGEGFALEVSVEKVGGKISMCGGELGGFVPSRVVGTGDGQLRTPPRRRCSVVHMSASSCRPAGVKAIRTLSVNQSSFSVSTSSFITIPKLSNSP